MLRRARDSARLEVGAVLGASLDAIDLRSVP